MLEKKYNNEKKSNVIYIIISIFFIGCITFLSFTISFKIKEVNSLKKDNKKLLEYVFKDLEIKNTLIKYYNLDSEYAELLGKIIKVFSERWKIDWRIVVAKIKVESNFDIFALQKIYDCRGLMQGQTNTNIEICHKLGFPWVGKEMLYNPYFSIMFGVYYLDEMRKCVGDNVKEYVIAYNIGIGNYWDIKIKKKKLNSNYDHWNKVKVELNRLGYKQKE